MPPFGPVSRRAFLVAGAALGVAGAAGVAGCASTIPESLDDGPWGWTRQAGPLELGVTHTEYSLAPTDPAPSRARAAAVLARSGRWQAQHLMGWGALDPEPAPGADDWSSLDPRLTVVAASGGRAVLTAAGAPDWMKGGAAGTTDFSRIEVAPRPEHHDDLAALVARAVARYPGIGAVQVWNEMKGYFDASRNTWDVVTYTDLYRRVRDAVKAVRADVLVGGPYVPLDLWADAGVAPSDLRGPWGVTDRRGLDAVEYWLAQNGGADFVCVDGGSATRDAGLTTDAVAATDRFAAATTWLRARTDLPVWWSEFYPEPTRGADGADDPASPARAAATLAAVAALARGGAAVALLWQPQAASSLPYAALWTDTADPGGGQATALTEPWAWLAGRLATGSVDLGRSPDGRLLGFRAGDGTLVVNTGAAEVTVSGAAVGAFGSVVIPR